jgi:hypothetical protein
MYRIRNYSLLKAKQLGVKIKPSSRSGKKLDIFKDGKKVASIGASGYLDYPTYLAKFGKAVADQKRKAYYKRHKNNISVKGSPGYYAARILW